MRVGDLVCGSLPIVHLSVFILNVFSSDAGLEGKLDEMDELDEFEPDEVHGALVFLEDEEEDMIDSNDKDDW